MPFKPCRRLLLFSAKLLLSCAHFLSFNNPLQRDSPACIPVPLADPSTSPNWSSTSVPHADVDNLTRADASFALGSVKNST